MTWDSNAGKERSTELAPFWPPKGAPEGSGVAGEVIEYGSYKAGSEVVPCVTIGSAVVREVMADGRTRMVWANEVTVSLNRALRGALRERDVPAGTCVQIEFRGKDRESGMFLYRVSVVDPRYVASLAGEAVRINA